jgi:hypothetical protein
MNTTQSLYPHGNFSFEYFVTDHQQIHVRFIEETAESRSAIISKTSISEFKELQDDDGRVKHPSEYYNSLLVSKPKNDGTPGLHWQYLNYFEPLVSDNNGNWVHYFKHYYSNYKIVIGEHYGYLNTTTSNIPKLLIGYFGSIDRNETESAGMHGYIHIKNERTNIIPVFIGFNHYEQDLDTNIYKYGWSASFAINSESFTLQKGEELLFEYTVVNTNSLYRDPVVPLIFVKTINILGNPVIFPSSSVHEVHVTYKDGRFVLYSVNESKQLTTLVRGQKYRFIYQDASYNQHLLRFSNKNDGYFS